MLPTGFSVNECSPFELNPEIDIPNKILKRIEKVLLKRIQKCDITV